MTDEQFLAVAMDAVFHRAPSSTFGRTGFLSGRFFLRFHGFTIRSSRDSGAKTELEKIVDGFGDWMFYGHSDESETGISRWMVINLASLMAALIRDKAPWKKKSNSDGTHFVAFDIRDLPESCLIAANFNIDMRKVA